MFVHYVNWLGGIKFKIIKSIYAKSNDKYGNA